MSSGKILVAQGGGPTAVINQSLVGVVLEARRFREVTRVYGAHHGVRGVINEDFVDLTQETSHNLELVAGTPAAALGSTRDKPDGDGGADSSWRVRFRSKGSERAGRRRRCRCALQQRCWCIEPNRGGRWDHNTGCRDHRGARRDARWPDRCGTDDAQLDEHLR